MDEKKKAVSDEEIVDIELDDLENVTGGSMKDVSTKETTKKSSDTNNSL